MSGIDLPRAFGPTGMPVAVARLLIGMRVSLHYLPNPERDQRRVLTATATSVQSSTMWGYVLVMRERGTTHYAPLSGVSLVEKGRVG